MNNDNETAPAVYTGNGMEGTGNTYSRKQYGRNLNPDGRTKKAYAHQPSLLPWKCSRCINAYRMQLLTEEKGRGHPSAKEVNKMSFATKERLDDHLSGHRGPAPGEQPTRNRLKRIAAVRKAAGF